MLKDKQRHNQPSCQKILDNSEMEIKKMNYPTKIIQSYKLGIISRADFVQMFKVWQDVEMARKAIREIGDRYLSEKTIDKK